jgi:hypothetical protein
VEAEMHVERAGRTPYPPASHVILLLPGTAGRAGSRWVVLLGSTLIGEPQVGSAEQIQDSFVCAHYIQVVFWVKGEDRKVTRNSNTECVYLPFLLLLKS